MSARRKQTTTTCLVTEALARADDFLTRDGLVERIDRTPEQVNSALYALKNYGAVDCVVSEGGLWWFATAQNDKRCKHIDERVEEFRPRHPKRHRGAK